MKVIHRPLIVVVIQDDVLRQSSLLIQGETNIIKPRANPGECPWVRIASSALSAMSLLKRNRLLAESALEAMRTQGAR
ncbi:MAG: hypothetical protein MOB07_04945 [Acidobacteria bacterium]|nr:hypothetical protein [Acidobacteriota bacterium]